MWVVYICVHWFVAGGFLYNCILALIVEEFTLLRERSEAGKNVQANVCFICNLHRSQFPDFELHLEQEHNRFHYVFFFDYLKNLAAEKGIEQMTSLELYVYNKIQKRDFRFIPNERCIALENVAVEEQDDEMVALRTKVEIMMEMIKRRDNFISRFPQLQEELYLYLQRLRPDHGADEEEGGYRVTGNVPKWRRESLSQSSNLSTSSGLDRKEVRTSRTAEKS